MAKADSREMDIFPHGSADFSTSDGKSLVVILDQMTAREKWKG
jgi:hypothetical protein